MARSSTRSTLPWLATRPELAWLGLARLAGLSLARRATPPASKPALSLARRAGSRQPANPNAARISPVARVFKTGGSSLCRIFVLT
jgi:hypothetical protein